MPDAYSSIKLNIKTLKHLSHRLGFQIDVLEKAATKAEKSYKFGKIPKKNGKGFRNISEPYPLLKSIQESIHRLLKEATVSEHAHCGIQKRSNLTNAKNHCRKKMIYSLDFKDFFSSIRHTRVYGLFFNELGCSPPVSRLLTRLCTVNGCVPQGGSMSMDIANLVCRKLDDRISGLCARYGVEYTRHCDDMTFSGNFFSDKFRTEVKKIINECGFPLNPEKEMSLPHHNSQTVVGLAVNRKRPLIPRVIRRKWRQEKHLFEKHEVGRLSEEVAEIQKKRIGGQQSYLNYINKG
ncbi:MAG: reverse transcriptase family protein [Desulfobacterales bacterium]|nr:reverse transcriptase family protein [Desulfobacterales bacterium]